MEYLVKTIIVFPFACLIVSAPMTLCGLPTFPFA